MPEKTTTAAKPAVERAARGTLRETPPPAVVSMLLGLQQTNGNHAVGNLLGGMLLQPRLRVGAPGDAYEREADRVADQILREGSEAPIAVSVAHASSRVQRQCHCPDEELVQRKCQCQEEEELIQPKTSSGSLRHPSGLEARVDALRGSGRPLPTVVRRFFEPRFGHDFAAVRVHTGAAASEAANVVGARAFTVGNDLVFGGGEWSPGTDAGKHLLAHELTHVVQQTPLVARRKPTLQRASEDVSEADPGTEESVTEPESAAPSQETQAPEPSQDEPASEPAPAEQAPAAAVVVEDDATEIGEGQMTKSDFLARVRPEVCAAAEAGLSGTEHSAQGCPFIEFAFRYYEGQSAERLNRDLPRFVGEGPRPTTAEEYIAAIVERVRVSVEVWAETGAITGVPRGLLLAGMNFPGVQGTAMKAAAAFGVQFKALPGGPRRPGSPEALRAQLGTGRPLDGGIRSRMESAFGRSFAHVQVHSDGNAAGLSHRLNARAFTVGNHVAFGAGEYRPGTIVGDALMAHELAHVAQQSGAAESVQPMASGSASYGALERDADIAAVGAVATLWGLRLPTPRLPVRATPRLSSGLRLQRCGDCNGQKAAPTTPTAPTAPEAGPKCCDFASFTSSGDTYTDSDKDTKKNIKFTFKVKDCADEKKCVMVNRVKGHSKSVKTGKPFKVTMFDKDVDYDFADLRIDSLDKDPVYWSDGGTRWRYDAEGKNSFFATDNPGPALRGEDWDLTFQMCLHCTDDVEETSDAAGSGVKNPLNCIDWTFKAKYDEKTKAWEH